MHFSKQKHLYFENGMILTICTDTSKICEIVLNVYFVPLQQNPMVEKCYSKLPPADCRRQCLNRTDAKVVSPAPGGFFGVEWRQCLNWTDAKVRWRTQKRQSAGGGVCCRNLYIEVMNSFVVIESKKVWKWRISKTTPPPYRAYREV